MDYVYDTLKRLTNKNFTADSTLNVAYSYDLGSRLTSANTTAANNAFTYDNLNRLASSTQALSGAARTLNYTYDKAGNQTQVTYPSGKAVAYTFDANDRTDLVKVNGINLADYNYDVLDRRTTRTFLSGNQQQAVYQYDLANQLSSITNTVLPSANISSYSYPAYDAVGNRMRMDRTFGADPVQTINYNYNNIYELTSVTGAQTNSYAYDGVANRTTADGVAYTKNDLNQYATVGGVNYSYDLNGNLINDGTNVYTYDTENRLTSFTDGSNNASYTYDAFNRRVSKTVNGVTTYFVYDSDSVVAEYDSSNSLLAEYVLGDNIDEVLSMGRGGTDYYYHYDGLGSVTEVTNSSGSVIESYTYDAYGNPSVTSSLIGNPYMFTGRRWDAESGTYYYRARQYNPLIGRFLQRDPIGYYDSLNLYQYVGNNPGNWVDPYGLWGMSRPGGQYNNSKYRTRRSRNRGEPPLIRGRIQTSNDVKIYLEESYQQFQNDIFLEIVSDILDKIGDFLGGDGNNAVVEDPLPKVINPEPDDPKPDDPTPTTPDDSGTQSNPPMCMEPEMCQENSPTTCPGT